MRVFGIDPGYDRVGIAFIERESDGNEKLIFSQCIETPKSSSLNERIFMLGTTISNLITTYKPDVIGIETLFFNKNVKTAIGVAQARGAILFIAQSSGCQVVEFGPQEIKIALTGYGKSDKKAVIHMVKHLVRNTPKNAHDDEYDAIAVAVTTLASYRG